MASGKSLQMSYIQPTPKTFYQAYTITPHEDAEKRDTTGMLNYHGPSIGDKDRSLTGKARIRARKAARRGQG